MKLGAWRKQTGWTQDSLALELGVTQPLISSLERTRKPARPSRELAVKIYVLTGGLVQPNDFYDLPALPDAQRKAA